MLCLYCANGCCNNGCDRVCDWLFNHRIHVSGKKIIVGNKRFKWGNCLLKKDGKNFLKIAIKAKKKCLCGPCLHFWRRARSKLNKAVWRKDMMNNPLDVRVNLRVFGVAGVILEFDYTISQLKNLENRGRQPKKRRQDTSPITESIKKKDKNKINMYIVFAAKYKLLFLTTQGQICLGQ